VIVKLALLIVMAVVAGAGWISGGLALRHSRQAQVDDAVNHQGLRVSPISIDNGELTLRGTHR
jgi:hypothetical protein